MIKTIIELKITKDGIYRRYKSNSLKVFFKVETPSFHIRHADKNNIRAHMRETIFQIYYYFNYKDFNYKPTEIIYEYNILLRECCEEFIKNFPILYDDDNFVFESWDKFKFNDGSKDSEFNLIF